MGTVSVGRTISSALGPVLTEAGFAPGQYGEGGDDRTVSGQVIFCATHDELSRRHPWLPQANAQEPGIGACIDLVLTYDGQGVLERVDLEGVSLEETFQLTGRAEPAVLAASLQGRPVADVLPSLEKVLSQLFRER